MKQKQSILLATAVAIICCLISCDRRVVWGETVSLSNNGWSPLQSVEFALATTDSILWQSHRPYNATLAFRYTEKCREKRVRIMIERESLDSICPADTLTVTLFNNDGTPANDRNSSHIGENLYQGKGLSLGVYEKRILIFENTPIEPMMRIVVTPISDSAVKGITDITLIIDE